MLRVRRLIVVTAAVAMLGITGFAGVAHAASGLVVTVTDGTSPINGAFVVAVNTGTGVAVDAGITDSNGVTPIAIGLNPLSSLRLAVSRQGYASAAVATVEASTTVTLTSSTSSGLKFTNVYGAQTRSVVADAESGVFYATTDGQPSVWRTVDFAGNWAPVPTKADSTSGLPQTTPNKLVVSGFPGEVAVIMQTGLLYSRDYGTTWTSLNSSTPFSNLWWAHSGTSSYLFARAADKMTIAVMSAATPELSDWTMPGSLTPGDLFDVVPARQSSNTVFVAGLPRENTTSAKVYELAKGASEASGVTVSAPITTSGMTANGGNQNDLLMISTLGTDKIAAIVIYDKEGTGNSLGGSTGDLKVAYSSDGATFTYGSGGLVGTTSDNNLDDWKAFTNISDGVNGYNRCGENETPPVGSIAPVSPSGSGLTSFKVVGTVRSCFFALNTSGSAADWAGQSGASVGANKIALLTMPGANNNTGFAFDAAYNFSNNFVALSGDGQFGLRKTATLSGPSWRPQFGSAGSDSADEFIKFQAKAGPNEGSEGIAVRGIVAPFVQDVAYSPNSTDGSTYLVSTGISGGSRTLLTTDGGTSFSTVNTAGATKLAWWNGNGSTQWILGSAPLNQKQLFRVKHFTTDNGIGPSQMGEELAATAAQRDAVGDTSLRFTTSNTPLMKLGTSCYGVDQFITTGSGCDGGQADFSQGRIDLTAAAGITGTNKVLLGVSKGESDRGQQISGTVALASLNPEGDSGATISGVKYFGSAVASGGTTADATTQFGVLASSTYTGYIKSIAYCPVGSAPKVADKAFIAVEGQGMFVISGISSGTPTHAATATTSSLMDLKVDCDTGILVAGSSSAGLMVSLDANTFVSVNTSPMPSDPKKVDIQASKESGDVTIVMGTGGSEVVEWDTSLTELGTTKEALSAGTASNPGIITPEASDVLSVNDPSDGRQVGQIQDIELPAESGDIVAVETSMSRSGSVRSMAVKAAGVNARVSQVGTASGSFRGSAIGPRRVNNPPVVNPPVVSPPVVNPPVVNPSTPTTSKVSIVSKGKSISIASAVKRAGGSIPSRSKVVVSLTSSSKKYCVVVGSTIKGVKAGTCSLTVKVTPPKTTKVKNPKTTTTKVTVKVK